jgi:hypothetical protein
MTEPRSDILRYYGIPQPPEEPQDPPPRKRRKPGPQPPKNGPRPPRTLYMNGYVVQQYGTERDRQTPRQRKQEKARARRDRRKK